MNKRFLPAADTLYVEDQDFTVRVPNGVLTDLALKLEGDVTAGGGAVSGLQNDAPWRLLDLVRLTVESRPIFAMHSVDLLHLSTYFTGRKPRLKAATPGAGNTSDFVGHAIVPFDGGIIQRAGVDGRVPTVELRSSWRPKAQYAQTNVSTLTSTKLRTAYAEWALPMLGTYREPRWMADAVDISSQSAQVHHQIYVPEPLAAAGIYIRARDSSVVGQAQNADGLVRRVRLNVTRGGRQDREPLSNTWGVWQEQGAARFNLASSDVPGGTIVIPLIDPSHPEGLMVFAPGDTIDLVLDTEADVENDFTAITPASGDDCKVVLIGWTERNFGAAA